MRLVQAPIALLWSTRPAFTKVITGVFVFLYGFPQFFQFGTRQHVVFPGDINGFSVLALSVPCPSACFLWPHFFFIAFHLRVRQTESA